MTWRRGILPLAGVALVAACFVSAPAFSSDKTSRSVDNDYRSAPLFYEGYQHDVDWVGDEIEQLRRGYVRVERYAPVDATKFDWSRDSFNDYTWFMQMQDLRFLLPALASKSELDVEIARAWFMRWYAEYMVPEPATASWGEPISVAYRAMVLALLLKVEERRAHPDTAVLDMLRATIRSHQSYLMATEPNDHLSNHGYLLALALYETTRVIPNPGARADAVERLMGMIRRTVSPAGIEMEHAVAYHFVVQVWVEQMAIYFRALPTPPRELTDALSKTFERMRSAGYFLQDHAGRMAPIGDTDSVMVDAISSGYRLHDAESGSNHLFDPASGYCIFKGAPTRGDCRYVIFRVPDGKSPLVRHLHSDALSVFFSHGGETVLGDAGRYGYESSLEREYVLSPSGHNVVLPDPIHNEGKGARVAYDVADHAVATGIEWSASVSIGREKWTRTVSVPDTSDSFRVDDSLGPGADASGAAELVMVWNMGTDVIETTATPPVDGGEQSWSLRTRAGQRVRITIRATGQGKPGMLNAALVHGQSDPRLGWYSPERYVLRPTTAIVVRLHPDPTVLVTTEVRVEKGVCAR